MPSVTLSKKEILRLIGKEIQDDELASLISFVGTDLESIEGDEINVEIFPNRPDMLSEQGLARALSSYLGLNEGFNNYEVKDSDYELIVDKSAAGVRPNTACAVIKGLKLDDEKIRELIQIQEKLHVTYGRNRKKVAIGIYPLEKIKFPITLFAEDPSKVKFVPLESNDVEMTGLQILSRHPTGRDYGFLLEGFDKFPFFKDAQNNILSMPPIINSELTGRITEETTDVFVECSGFDQKYLDVCLAMIVTSLVDMGGDIYSIKLINEVDNFEKVSPNLSGFEIPIEAEYANKVLGLELNEADLKLYLSRMGYDYDLETKQARVPSYRADVLHPIDLVEDIAIAYGYFNFERDIPNCATVAKRDIVDLFKNKVAEILSGLGFYETNTYCLIGKDQGTELVNSSDELVELVNSVTEGYNALRRSLLPSLLLALKNNRHRDYPQGFFETSIVFKPGDTETRVEENLNLSFVYADANADYTIGKQALDYLLSSLGLKYKVKSAEHTTFIEGRVAEIYLIDPLSSEEVLLGVLGQISPEVLSNFELEVPVSAFEINFNKLVDLVKKRNLTL